MARGPRRPAAAAVASQLSLCALLLCSAAALAAHGAAAAPAPAAETPPLPVADDALRSFLAPLYARAREAVRSTARIPPVSETVDRFGALPPAMEAHMSCQRPAGERAAFMMMGERIRTHLQRVVVVVSLNTPDACAAVPRWWSVMRSVLEESRVRFIVPAEHADAPPCQALARVVAFPAPEWKPAWRPSEPAWTMYIGFLAAVQDLLSNATMDGVLFVADDVLLSPWLLATMNLNHVVAFPHGLRPGSASALAGILASQKAFVAHVFDSPSPPPYAANVVPSRYAPGTVTHSTANQDMFFMPQRLLEDFAHCLEDAVAWGVADFCIAFSTCQKAVEHESGYQTAVMTRAWRYQAREHILAARIRAIVDERVDFIHPCKMGQAQVYAAAHALFSCLA